MHEDGGDWWPDDGTINRVVGCRPGGAGVASWTRSRISQTRGLGWEATVIH